MDTMISIYSTIKQFYFRCFLEENGYGYFFLKVKVYGMSLVYTVRKASWEK